jgi:hypothetical protein
MPALSADDGRTRLPQITSKARTSLVEQQHPADAQHGQERHPPPMNWIGIVGIRLQILPYEF